jgi:hypothetical protein
MWSERETASGAIFSFFFAKIKWKKFDWNFLFSDFQFKAVDCDLELLF